MNMQVIKFTTFCKTRCSSSIDEMSPWNFSVDATPTAWTHFRRETNGHEIFMGRLPLKNKLTICETGIRIYHRFLKMYNKIIINISKDSYVRIVYQFTSETEMTEILISI